MMSTAYALANWFHSFGIPVYLEDDVPDNTEMPYITIPLKEPEWSKQTSYQINVWYRTTSNAAAIYKADEIVAAVRDGVRIPFTGGLLVLWPDNPLQQEMLDGEYRAIHISLILNAYHLPGM